MVAETCRRGEFSPAAYASVPTNTQPVCMQKRSHQIRFGLVAALALGTLAGCQVPQAQAPLAHEALGPPLGAGTIMGVAPGAMGNPALHPQPGVEPVGSEKSMVALPTYQIEPPDILEIDALKVVPKPPYKIEPLDFLTINANTPPSTPPITGSYGVEPGGAVMLGAAYGRVHVAGMTLEEASEAINRQLSRTLEHTQVSVTLLSSEGQQKIAGQHRVGPDGTVNLGTYGTVFVTGLTVEQAKKAIEAQLSKYLDTPEVSVDVFSFNSKVYYVIGQGAGTGDSLTKFQITGNETVLDALAFNGGLRSQSSKRIWIARPTPGGCDQILPVNYDDITRGAATASNYQILPGDRVYIAEDKLIAFNSFVTKVLSPIQQLFGFTELGVNTVTNTQHPGIGLR